MLYAYALTTSVFEKSGLANKKGAAKAISASFVTTVGAGVPSAYGSNVNAYYASLRNLPIAAEGFDKSATSGCVYVTCPVRYPSSPLPSSQSILSCSVSALFEDHFVILPLTLVGGTSPAQSHQCGLMETMTPLTLTSDSKISAT